eukprot:34414_1
MGEQHRSNSKDVKLLRQESDSWRDWFDRCMQKSQVFTGLSVLFIATPAYFCVYAIRTPLLVPLYKDELAFGIPLKEAFGIAQTFGYTLGKIPAIIYFSRLTRTEWRRALHILMFAATILLFGMTVPINEVKVISVMCAISCISPTWGIFLRYMEGRRMSDLMFAGFNFSFIAASGVWRTVSAGLLEGGVSEWWNPLLVATMASCAFHPLVIFLDMAPEPTVEEQAARSKRKPATTRSQLDMVLRWWPGLTALIAVYSMYSLLRNYYDFFNPEIWLSITTGKVDSSVYTLTDVPVAVSISISLMFLYIIQDNRTGFFVIILYMAMGCVVLALSTFAFSLGALSGFAWMFTLGLGMLMVYVPLGGIIYERLIAVGKEPITMTFLSYLSDGCGAAMTIAFLVYKACSPKGTNDDYRTTFAMLTYIAAISGISLFVTSAIYFYLRIRGLKAEPKSITGREGVQSMTRKSTPNDDPMKSSSEGFSVQIEMVAGAKVATHVPTANHGDPGAV